MNFDKSLKEVTILFVLICNGKDFLLVNELVLIKESIGDNRHVELLVFFVLDVLILIIIFMMNLQKAKRICHAKPSKNLVIVLLKHVGN
jgi:hypothetical protein